MLPERIAETIATADADQPFHVGKLGTLLGIGIEDLQSTLQDMQRNHQLHRAKRVIDGLERWVVWPLRPRLPIKRTQAIKIPRPKRDKSVILQILEIIERIGYITPEICQRELNLNQITPYIKTARSLGAVVSVGASHRKMRYVFAEGWNLARYQNEVSRYAKARAFKEGTLK